jgi:heptosyltransferase-2
MRRALVKPDHVGDLVLSQPAIQALIDSDKIDSLFVNSRNIPLAKYLFPKMDIQTMDFPHLSRSHSQNTSVDLNKIKSYDEVIFLRRDHILNENYFEDLLKKSIFIGNDGRHVATNQKAALNVHYDLEYKIFDKWKGKFKPWPKTLKEVCFSIGSGFPTNRWPTESWCQLGKLLKTIGTEKVIIMYGNQEVSLAANLRQKLLTYLEVELLNGQEKTFEEISSIFESISLTIGSDGGSNHVASLFGPNLALFTSSSPNVWAPIGLSNRSCTLALTCVSQCLNFHEKALNACLTRECSYGLEPEMAFSSLHVDSEELLAQPKLEKFNSINYSVHKNTDWVEV